MEFFNTSLSDQNTLRAASELSLPEMRRALAEIRKAWAAHSPEEICYPTRVLANGLTIETVALAKVCEGHRRRHQKSKRCSPGAQ